MGRAAPAPAVQARAAQIVDSRRPVLGCPETPMRRTHMLLFAATAGLLGYAGYAVVSGGDDGPPPDELVAEGAAGGNGKKRVRPDRTTAKFIKPLLRTRDEGKSYEGRSHKQPILPPPPTVGEISADDALVAFNTALDDMDDALDKGRPSRKRKRELYMQATNAFTALSTHLDATNPEQRVVLEQAHSEMKQRMKALKMKVPRRYGVVLEPAG